MDRIDPLFYALSSRIDLKEETRIKATSEEASEWEENNKSPTGMERDIFDGDLADDFSSTAPAPNFISNIFYLTIAMSHYGYLRTIQSYNDLGKRVDELQRHLDMLNGDGSWMGVCVSSSMLDFYLQSYRAHSKHARKLLSTTSRKRWLRSNHHSSRTRRV